MSAYPQQKGTDMPTIDRDGNYTDVYEHDWANLGLSRADRDFEIARRSLILRPIEETDPPPDVPATAIRAVLREARMSASRFNADCRCRPCGRIRQFASEHPTGRDDNGRDYEGRDEDGYNEDGYDRRGYNRDGWTEDGYDREGYNEDGYNCYGYDRNGYNEEGYDAEGFNEDGYDEYGNERDSGTGLEYYSYTPRLRFRGDKAPYYGMEIEVTTDYPGRLVDTVNEIAEPNLIYCKEDGSVAGAEMVTHPMTYDWAMENFPWDLLPALRESANATVISEDNGIHIHVSRDGFDTPAHMFRFLKFWYRNPNDIQRIARRRSSSWSAFSPEHRASHKEHVKRDNNASPRLGNGASVMCECGDPACRLEIGRRSGRRNPNAYDSDNDYSAHQRYAAVNTTNSDTLEVRVFASTLRPRRAQAALQLVAGSVEYTRQLTAVDVNHRHGWDWQAFMSWAGKDGRYPALVTEDRVRRSR